MLRCCSRHPQYTVRTATRSDCSDGFYAKMQRAALTSVHSGPLVPRAFCFFAASARSFRNSMSRRKEDEAGRRIKGRGAESRTVRASCCCCGCFCCCSSLNFRTLPVVVKLQVYPARSPCCHECQNFSCIFVISFTGYESLADSGSGAGPQRSVEGWVVFVTGIYEEAQVHVLAVATAAV